MQQSAEVKHISHVAAHNLARYVGRCMGRHDSHVTPESLTTAVETTIQLDCQSVRAGEADKWILLTDENAGGRCDRVVVVAEAMEVEDMSPVYSFESSHFCVPGLGECLLG